VNTTTLRCGGGKIKIEASNGSDLIGTGHEYSAKILDFSREPY
jgi:hypothetical protein